MKISSKSILLVTMLGALVQGGCNGLEAADGAAASPAPAQDVSESPLKAGVITNAKYNWNADPVLTGAQKQLLANLQGQTGAAKFEAEPWEHGASIYRLDLAVLAPQVGGATMAAQRVNSAMAFITANQALWNLQAPVGNSISAINYDPLCDNVTLQANNVKGFPVYNALLRVSFSSDQITEVVGHVDGRHLGPATPPVLTIAQGQAAFKVQLGAAGQWASDPTAPAPPVPTQVVLDPLYTGDLASSPAIAYAYGLNQTAGLSAGGAGGEDPGVYVQKNAKLAFQDAGGTFISRDGDGLTQRMGYYIQSTQGTFSGSLIVRGETEIAPFRALAMPYTPPAGAVTAGAVCNPDPEHWMTTYALPATSGRSAPVTPSYVGLLSTARPGSGIGGIGVVGATLQAQAENLLSNPVIAAMYGDADPALHLRNPVATTDSAGNQVVTMQEFTDDGLPVDGAYQSVVIAPANPNTTGFNGVAVALHSKFLYFPTISPKLAVVTQAAAITAATNLYVQENCGPDGGTACQTAVNQTLNGWAMNPVLEVASTDIYPHLSLPTAEPLGLVYRLSFPERAYLWSAEVSGVGLELPYTQQSQPPTTIFNDTTGKENGANAIKDFITQGSPPAFATPAGDTPIADSDTIETALITIFKQFAALGFQGADKAGTEMISEFADYETTPPEMLCISPTAAGVQFTIGCFPLCTGTHGSTSCSLNLPGDATINGVAVAPGQLIHMLATQVVNDRIAHEYTHGITWNTARLWDFSDETGALNESYSDVFSQIIFPNADGTWHTNTKAGVLNNLEEPNKDAPGSPMSLAQETAFGCSATCMPGGITDGVPTGDCQHCWASIASLAVALASDGQRIVTENQKDFPGSMANGACTAIPAGGVGGRANLSQVLFDTLTTRLQQADRFVNQAIDVIETCNADLATVPALTPEACETLQNAYTCVGVDPGYAYGSYTAVACGPGGSNTFQANPGNLFNGCAFGDLTLNGNLGSNPTVAASFDAKQSISMGTNNFGLPLVSATFLCGGVQAGTPCTTQQSYQVGVNTTWNICLEAQQVPGADGLGAQWIPPQDQVDNTYTLWVTQAPKLGPGLTTASQCDAPFGTANLNVCSTNTLVHTATFLNGESGVDTINGGLQLNPQCAITAVNGQNGGHGNFSPNNESFDSDVQEVCYVFGCTGIGENHFWGGSSCINPGGGNWSCPLLPGANAQDLTVQVGWEHNGTSEVEMRPVYTIAQPLSNGDAGAPNCLAGLPLAVCP